TDEAGAIGEKELTLQVVDPLEITTPSFSTVTVGQTVSEPVMTAGGFAPLSWEVTAGALPTGLTLDPESGIAGGAPIEGGEFSFTLQATDADGRIASHSYSWEVSGELSIVTEALP